MTTSQTIAELSAALVAVHAELPGGVTFDATNPFLKNKYATLGALIDASRETLAKHGLAIVQHPTSVEGGVAVQTTILHKSGEFIYDTVAISMQDEKGKSMAQVAGSIITYLRRYAYASVLGLYGEEDTDGNTPPGKPATANPRANTGTPARPAPQPTTRPAARTADVANLATEAQKAKFIEKIQPVSDYALELFTKWGWITGEQGMEDIPLAKVPTTERMFDAIMLDIKAFMDGDPVNNPDRPTDEGADDPWRSYPVPFGRDKGTTLGELRKESLFGWWANYDPTTDKDGKPKAKVYASDREFREMLDAAGAHYEFTKKD